MVGPTGCTANPPCVRKPLPWDDVKLYFGGPGVGRKAVAIPATRSIYVDPEFWAGLKLIDGRKAILNHEWSHLEGARCEQCADRWAGEKLSEKGQVWSATTPRDALATMRDQLQHRDTQRACDELARGFGYALADQGDGYGADDQTPEDFADLLTSLVPDVGQGDGVEAAPGLAGLPVISITPNSKMVTGYRDGQPFDFMVGALDATHYMELESSLELVELIRAFGKPVTVSSAFRTMAEQQALYDGFKKGLPGFNPADKPGYSKHQSGDAVDLAFATTADREAFAAFVGARGWTRPVSGEPWHFVRPGAAPRFNVASLAVWALAFGVFAVAAKAGK